MDSAGKKRKTETDDDDSDGIEKRKREESVDRTKVITGYQYNPKAYIDKEEKKALAEIFRKSSSWKIGTLGALNGQGSGIGSVVAYYKIDDTRTMYIILKPGLVDWNSNTSDYSNYDDFFGDMSGHLSIIGYSYIEALKAFEDIVIAGEEESEFAGIGDKYMIEELPTFPSEMSRGVSAGGLNFSSMEGSISPIFGSLHMSNDYDVYQHYALEGGVVVTYDLKALADIGYFILDEEHNRGDDDEFDVENIERLWWIVDTSLDETEAAVNYTDLGEKNVSGWKYYQWVPYKSGWTSELYAFSITRVERVYEENDQFETNKIVEKHATNRSSIGRDNLALKTKIGRDIIAAIEKWKREDSFDEYEDVSGSLMYIGDEKQQQKSVHKQQQTLDPPPPPAKRARLFQAYNDKIVNIIALTGATDVYFFDAKRESDAYDALHPRREVPEDITHFTHKIEGLMRRELIGWDIPDNAFAKDKYLTDKLFDAFRADAAVIDYFGDQLFVSGEGVGIEFVRARHSVGLIIDEDKKFVDFTYIPDDIRELVLSVPDNQDEAELVRLGDIYRVIIFYKEDGSFRIWNDSENLNADSDNRIYVTMTIFRRRTQ